MTDDEFVDIALLLAMQAIVSRGGGEGHVVAHTSRVYAEALLRERHESSVKRNPFLAAEGSR